MIITRLWKPDTCTCEIEYSYDDALPSEQQVFSLSRLIKRGGEHFNVVDGSLYQVLFEENSRKNRALGIANLHTGIDESEIGWSYTPGRVLEISFQTNVPGSIKNQIAADCETQLGVGKVVVS